MQHTISIQQQLVRQQKALLRRGNIQCWLDPNLAKAAAVGVDVPGLNPQDLDINSRLCRLLAIRFLNGIAFDGSTTFQNMILLLMPASAAPITPALARATLMDPPRLVASLTSLRRPDSRSGRRSLSFLSSFVATVSSTSSSSTAVTVGVASSSSTAGAVTVASSSTVSSPTSRVGRSTALDYALVSSLSLDPDPSSTSAWSSKARSVSSGRTVAPFDIYSFH